MAGAIEFFKEGGLSDEEVRRQRTFVLWFTAVITLYLFAFGTYRLLYTPSSMILIVIDLGAGAALSLNLTLFYLHRRLLLMKTIGTLIVSFALLGLFYHGESVFWLCAFPPAAFVFNGVRKGVILNAIFITGIAVLSFLQSIGRIDTGNTPGTILQLWWALCIIVVLGFISEQSWEAAQEKVLAQRERMRALLKNLPAGVLMADRNGLIIAANDMMERLLGRTLDAAVSIDDFASTYRLEQERGKPCTAESLPFYAVRHGKDEEANATVFIGGSDGVRRAIRIRAASIRGSRGADGTVAIFEDMTKEHEVERLRSELVSLVSHQLKTPLTGMRWSNESLLSGDLGPLNGEQSAAIRDHISTIDRLARLVTDVLSISHIDGSKPFDLVRSSTDATLLIDDVMSTLDSAASRRGISIGTATLRPRCMLDVDPAKVKELFINLVSNAIKYSKEGGHVEVGIEREDSGTITMYVKDDGIGIPREQQAKIFERFFRADNVGADIEGTGLGLHIAKIIVEKHGGQLWFVSKEGEGTTFFVTLPKAKE